MERTKRFYFSSNPVVHDSWVQQRFIELPDVEISEERLQRLRAAMDAEIERQIRALMPVSEPVKPYSYSTAPDRKRCGCGGVVHTCNMV